MEDESKDPTFAPGFPSAEQRLSSLKPYAHLAWEECKAPVGDGNGSAQLRWEVFNTWMLLLSLHHVEAERERCERWKCEAWNNEAQAMRHLFMRNYHLRALQAILRWLRWSHRWAPSQADRKEEFSAYTAGYERTRRAQQLRRLPSPVQACSIVHPDGPLQSSEQFQPADLEDERQLLADLWTCLRRGELSKGLKLCAESGQAWRTALLQGMMPFAKADNVSYDITEAAGPDEETEEMLALMKEEHTDWTEFGQPKHYSHGNPWRKLWKEQCFDSAVRNLQSGSTMDLCELSIYGFCSGNYDALMPYCGTFWADRCWGELHCIKEWLVERLLEDGHAWRGEASLCEIDEDPDERDIRSRKLCGRLDARLSPDLGRAVAEEVQQALSRVFPRTSGDAYWEVPESVSEQFSLLQALLIESAWIPQRGQAALDLLRSWLQGGRAPFLVKQFASYFARQKEMLQVPRSIAAVQETQDACDPQVDDIIWEHVQELILAASGAHWQEQCLHGKAVEIILEHCAVLQPELRREAFAELLLRVGSVGADASVACAVALARGEFTAQAQVMKRCFAVFWSRFPFEVFAAMAGLVHRVLKLDQCTNEALLDGVPAGVQENAHAEDMVHLILCLLVFWTIARDKASEGESVEQAQEGLKALVGEDMQTPGLLEILAGDPREAFLRAALGTAIVPLLADTLLCLCVKEPALALPMLPPLEASVLWTDAFNSAAANNLSDLEWLLLLYVKHNAWKVAFREASAQQALAAKPTLVRFGAAVQPGPGSGHAAEADKAAQESKIAREALLDWAQDRLARPRPLVEPQPRSQTALPEAHVQNLRKALAWRALLPLINLFEAELDFQGVMQDLFVSIDESPWMLKMLDQRHARALLSRVAHIPMSSEWPPPGSKQRKAAQILWQISACR